MKKDQEEDLEEEEEGQKKNSLESKIFNEFFIHKIQIFF